MERRPGWAHRGGSTARTVRGRSGLASAFVEPQKDSGCGAREWLAKAADGTAQCASHSMESCEPCLVHPVGAAYHLQLVFGSQRRGVLLALGTGAREHSLMLPCSCSIGSASRTEGQTASCVACSRALPVTASAAVAGLRCVDGYWCAVAGQGSEAGGSGHAVGCLPWHWRRRGQRRFWPWAASTSRRKMENGDTSTQCQGTC